MTPLVFGFARVDDLGDQGKAENDKQGSGDCVHRVGPFEAAMPKDYRAKRARI